MGNESLGLLKKMLGENIEFRAGQEEAIDGIVSRKARILLVQRTGWGKSIVYFIATRMLRDRGSGPALLISPLLSLMRNQIEMAEKAGVIKALRWDSSNSGEWAELERRLKSDQADILLISPERLANEHFRKEVIPLIPKGIGFFIIDEAHCISDWGHDFRPDYRRIVRIVKGLTSNIPILATTATANNRVIEDIREQLGSKLEVMRGGLARETLRLQNIVLRDQAERLAWLAQIVPKFKGSGIIYCLTIADTIRVASWLRKYQIEAYPYHADLDNDQRQHLESSLINNKVKALVATVALGMGFDKPDLKFVIHFQRPGSVIAYYQQVGRAGRAMKRAYGILLSGEEDDEIINYFIDTAFPEKEHLIKIVQAIEKSEEGLSTNQIQPVVNLSWGRIEQALKMLEIDGAIFKNGSKYVRTLKPWKPDVERNLRITHQRRGELQKMNEYLHHKGCLMEFLTRELDDPDAKPCGQCSSCGGIFMPETPDENLLIQAVRFLRGNFVPIEVKKMAWTQMNGSAKRKKIPEGLLNCEGRALCYYGDAGWGRMVAEGKYRDGKYCDELVEASTKLIMEIWRPNPAPKWITCIPSLRKTELVPDFARRLSARLGIPFRMVLVKNKETQEQKSMQNSFHKWNNIHDVFEINAKCQSEPVLLVDDIVDSGWTLTSAGMSLRQNGSGAVYPFTLANASTRGNI